MAVLAVDAVLWKKQQDEELISLGRDAEVREWACNFDSVTKSKAY